jgi:hypothetical protein
MRLYHCTTNSNAASIRRSGFRCGSSGLTGAGIYFADASRKAQSHGVVLECKVNLGRVKHVSSGGDNNLNLQQLNRDGYDSVCIPRNGTEYCVYEPSRVQVLGEHRDPRASSHVSSPRVSRYEQYEGDDEGTVRGLFLDFLAHFADKP